MKRLIIILSILTISNNKNTMYCDIKGSVVNPGVYEIKNNYTIKDIIEEAGGLKENSYTDNINLSKKVIDEMVIYINTKEEINRLKKLNDCDCSTKYEYIECNKNKTADKYIEETTKTTEKTILTTISIFTKSNSTKATTKHNNTTTTKTLEENTVYNKLININTCTIDDLMKLKGLGEKKAYKIIEYRDQNGLFNTIEDIMKVSGIGESTYNAIKEYIEV